MEDKFIQSQQKLEKIYRIIFIATIITIILGVAGLFIQVYSLSAQINLQVDKIVQNQSNNRSITDKQNSLVLGYLICIGKVPAEDRTDAVIKLCVERARTVDIRNL